MSKSKIPTILAILILVTVLAAILYVVNQIQTFASNAGNNFTVQDVRVTNIKDTSVSISWLTDTPTIGVVEYTNNTTSINSTPTLLLTTHFVTLTNLNPSSTYTFKINSQGNTTDNNGNPWQFQTLSPITPQEGQIVYGQVVNSTNLPAKNALVYVTIPAGQTFSAQVSASGNWLVTLPQLTQDTLLEITIESSPSLTSNAKVNLQGATPVPTITLGKSYDFKDIKTSSPSDTPKVPINLP